MLKFWTTFLTEILNIFFLMSTFSPLSLIQNFVSLQVIATFPYAINGTVQSPLQNMTNEAICESIFVVQHTTSSKARAETPSKVLDDYGKPYPLRIQFKDRSCGNKLLYIFYRLQKYIYVNIYFYYTTPMILLMSLYVPLFLGDGATNDGQ